MSTVHVHDPAHELGHGVPNFAANATKQSLTAAPAGDPAVVAALQQQIADATASLTTLQSSLESIDESIGLATVELGKVQWSLSEVQQRLSVAQQSTATLRTTEQETEDLIADLERQLAEAKVSLSTTQAMLEVAATTEEALATRVEELESDIADIEADIDEFTAQRMPIADEVAATEATITQLEADLAAAQQGETTVGPDDVVHLGATTVSVIDGPITVKAIGVHGLLTLKSGCELRIHTLLNFPNGEIVREPGSRVIFRDLPLDLDFDPSQWGGGFLCFGKLRSIGTEKTEYMRLAAEPIVGSTTLELEDIPLNWNAGDRLILPDTRGGAHPARLDKGGDEWLTIASIDGTTLEVNEPIQWEHRGARNRAGEIVKLPHVANMTRDITWESENPAGIRGHVALIHRADVDIRHNSFHFMGRTQPVFDAIGPKGRYFLHAHHLLGPEGISGAQFTIRGNVIEDDAHVKWGLVVHGSSWGDVSRNIVYNTGGAGFVTEDGNEVHNLFDGNLVIMPGSQTAGNFKIGDRRDGYWLRGPMNHVVRNLYYGVNSSINFFCQNNADLAGVDYLIATEKGAEPSKLVDIRALPLLSMDGNESWRAKHPLEIWDLHKKLAQEGDDPEPEPVLITGTVACNGANTHGGFNFYSTRLLDIRDSRLLGETKYRDPANLARTICQGWAVELSLESVSTVSFHGIEIVGYQKLFQRADMARDGVTVDGVPQ